jgi:hypothetical protein
MRSIVGAQFCAPDFRALATVLSLTPTDLAIAFIGQRSVFSFDAHGGLDDTGKFHAYNSLFGWGFRVLH